MSGYILRRQLYFLEASIRVLPPAEPGGLDSDLSFAEGNGAVFAGQVQPHLARARLERVLKPEVVVARQREVASNIGKRD